MRKGQKIAQLDLFKLNNTLVQNKNSLAQATLEMQDVLIGQGYAPDNLKVIPADVLELAKVKSGYEQSKAQYATTRIKYYPWATMGCRPDVMTMTCRGSGRENLSIQNTSMSVMQNSMPF